MASYPPTKGIGLLLATGGIVLSGALTFAVWHHSLAPIQSAYLPVYLRAQYIPTAESLGLRATTKRYAVLTLNGQNATFWNMPSTMTGLGVRYIQTSPRLFCAWLKQAVYEGQSGMELLQTPLILWAIFSLVSILGALLLLSKTRNALRHGRRVRGPQNMTPAQFNRSQGYFSKKGFALEIEPSAGHNDRT